MRKTTLILFCLSIVAIYSCTESPQKKANKLINNTLKKSLNDYNSYELVEISNLDSLFSSPEDDSAQYKDSIDRANILIDLAKESHRKYETYKDLSSFKLESERHWAAFNYYLDESKKTLAFLEHYNDTFKPKFIGWTAIHRFRANNAMGNKVLSIYEWEFDTLVNSITNYKQIDN